MIMTIKPGLTTSTIYLHFQLTIHVAAPWVTLNQCYPAHGCLCWKHPAHYLKYSPLPVVEANWPLNHWATQIPEQLSFETSRQYCPALSPKLMILLIISKNKMLNLGMAIESGFHKYEWDDSGWQATVLPMTVCSGNIPNGRKIAYIIGKIIALFRHDGVAWVGDHH